MDGSFFVPSKMGRQHLLALHETKGVFSFAKENTPFGTPRERRGAFPSTPSIGSPDLEGLHALRSVSAVYVAAPRAFCVSIHLSTARTP